MSCARVQDMPLMQHKKPNPTPPTNHRSTSLNEQEILQRSKHDLAECFSDDGYPSLPRPKVILSLRHSDAGTWSHRQASLLQTVPVRILNSGNDREQPTERARARALSLDTVTGKSHRNTLTLPSTSKKASKKSQQSKNSTVSRAKLARSKSLSHAKSSSTLEPVCSSPLLSDSREPSQTPPGQQSPTQDMSSNHSRVLSRRTAAEVSKASGGQSKSKKPRRISRAITFAFGAGSDKKRRSLGFLGSKDKDLSEDPSVDCGVPSSPILMGKRRSHLSGSSSVHDFQRRAPEDAANRFESSGEWGSVPVYPRQDGGGALVRNHFGSCRDFHSISEIEEVRYQPRVPLQIPVRLETETPDYSPTASGFSSRQESFESLSLSTLSEPVLRRAISNPPSRSHSPNMFRSGVHDGHVTVNHRERKLSDPAPSTPELDSPRELGSPASNSSPKGSTLKKRNTFCVRETRQTQKPGWHEMRHHVVRFLLETEQSYVQSLQSIIKVYMEPLHRPQAIAIIDPSLAKDIFHQIPEIYQLHEKFLGQVAARVEGWTPESKIGDVFVNTFSRCHLMDVYKKFIGNFRRAKSAIEIAKQAKPMFAKFLEQRAKDSRGRFTLDDLLIKPVQRIPRYVLFIKDLLKHTSVGHTDHAPLQQALGELTSLAEKVNTSERERGRLEEQRELIAGIDGLAQLMNAQSKFIRYDMVTEIKGNVQKKDRFLILFSDMVVCACARRKSSGFIRGSLLNLNSSLSEALKHSVKWYAPLTKVSLAQLQGPSFDRRKQNTIEKMLENLRKDEKTLQQMMELTASLHTPHQSLTSALKNLQSEVRDRASEKRTELENLPVESGRIDLISYALPPPTQYALVFPNQRIRSSWEADFIQAKTKADQQAPPNSTIAPPTSPIPCPSDDVTTEFKFLKPMALQPGRISTELTCGSVGLPVDCDSACCLWVCCGDVHSGQVSIVDLFPSSSTHTLATITVTDSRITCITAVPSHHHTPVSEESSLLPTVSVSSFSSSNSGSSLSSCSEEDSKLEVETSNLVSTPELIENGPVVTDSPKTIYPKDRLRLNIDLDQMRSSSAPPIPDPSLTVDHEESPFSPPESAKKFYSPLTIRSATFEWGGVWCEQSCMWLGTKNGQLFVYSPGNNLRSRSHRLCVQLDSPVTCLRYHERCVYVGLSCGVLTIFDSSDPGAEPMSSVRVSDMPVVSCVPLVTGVGVCSGDTLYSLAADKESVTPLATLPSGQVISDAMSVVGGVWVSVCNSPTLHLLHIPSGETLTSVDCTAAVMTILQGYNPIIRQHKSSGLQVTALLTTPTHLVVGTSAGVVVCFPQPVLEHSLEPRPISQPPSPVALPKGHVGPVTFLTSVVKEKTSFLISGGNGCEDLTTMTTSSDVPETCNCLLLWSLHS